MMGRLIVICLPALISAFEKAGSDRPAASPMKSKHEKEEASVPDAVAAVQAGLTDADQAIGIESESLFSAGKSYVDVLESLLMHELKMFFEKLANSHDNLKESIDIEALINDLTRDFVLYKDEFMDKVKEAAMSLLTKTEGIMNMAHLVGKDKEVGADINALTDAMYSAFDMLEKATDEQTKAIQDAFKQMQQDHVAANTGMIKAMIDGTAATNSTFGKIEDDIDKIEQAGASGWLAKHRANKATDLYPSSDYAFNSDIVNWEAYCASNSAHEQMCPLPCTWDSASDDKDSLCRLSCDALNQNQCGKLSERVDNSVAKNPPCYWTGSSCKKVELKKTYAEAPKKNENTAPANDYTSSDSNEE